MGSDKQARRLCKNIVNATKGKEPLSETEVLRVFLAAWPLISESTLRVKVLFPKPRGAR